MRLSFCLSKSNKIGGTKRFEKWIIISTAFLIYLTGRGPMDNRRRQILLLARPGYYRNGIEAMLLTIDNIFIQTVSTYESAAQILTKITPDLLLVYPRMLDVSLICSLCQTFFENKKNRVLFLTEPYDEEYVPIISCDYQVFQINTLGQLKQIILEKLG